LRSPYVPGDGHVAGSRLPRDRPVRAGGAGAAEWWVRKVIIKFLWVIIRSFSTVTAPAGRKPGRAGHEAVRRRAEARQRGNGPGPPDDLGTGRFVLSSGADHRVGRPRVGRRPRRGNCGQRPSAGPIKPDQLIGTDAHFTALAACGAAVKSGLSHPPVFAGRCNYARVLPGGRTGRLRCCARVASGGVRGFGGCGRSGGCGPGWPARPPGPGGREAAVAAILMISSAS